MALKHLFLVPAVGLIALLAVACDSGGDTIIQNTNQGATGISAAGTGRAFGEPDVAIISVGVNVQRETVEQARADAAAAQEAVIDSLMDNGVAEEDIQTVQFSVSPQYDFRNDGRGEIIGYVVNNVVSVKVRDLDTTGEVIDAATVAGGNDAVVQGVSFTIDDPSELQAEARRMAVERAREQAEQLADAAGVDLGDIISISESGGFIPFQRAEAGFDMAAGAQAPPTPLEPGQVEVNVTVNMQFALQQ